MADQNNKTVLGALNVGFSGTIKGFIEDSHTTENVDRLREMGFSEGLAVSILHQNPFGRDPIAINVGNMTVALRRREANLIEVSLP